MTFHDHTAAQRYNWIQTQLFWLPGRSSVKEKHARIFTPVIQAYVANQHSAAVQISVPPNKHHPYCTEVLEQGQKMLPAC